MQNSRRFPPGCVFHSAGGVFLRNKYLLMARK
jgi:hypothetical protein